MNIREAPVKLEIDIAPSEDETDVVVFDIRLGAGANAPKYRVKVRKFSMGTKEEWLIWREEFANLIQALPLNTAAAQHSAIKSLLRGDALSRYTLFANGLGRLPDLDEINNRINEMTAEVMSSDSVRLTLEYLRQVRKPRSMTVQAYQARIMSINSLIPFMPNGNENLKLTDVDVKQIIENGVPVAWRRQQRAAHLTTFNLQETVSYYNELQALELEANRSQSKQQ
ncbi:MAG: hypothetical protein ACREOZ_04215 [Gloeomargaritales cyanobacterium]